MRVRLAAAPVLKKFYSVFHHQLLLTYDLGYYSLTWAETQTKDVTDIPVIDVGRCDLNGDKKVNATDLTILARHVAKIERITDADKLKLADMNGDTLVTAADLTALARYIKAQKVV